MNSSLPLGKLRPELLRDLLARHGPNDPRVLVGPGLGRDAAVIEMGDRCLVAKTDPITFATDEIGWYAVHVNANDVACCGAVPRWFLATVLLPETHSTAGLVESIFAQIDEACRQLGVSLSGGHTEITHGLDRPIVVGQMLGEAPRDGYVTAAGARVGDAILVTKGIAIEGTAVIAGEKRNEAAGVLSAEEIDRCRNLLHQPGISVVRDARIALETGGVRALHDPTEGGVATALWELSEAAALGLSVEESALPILPECRRLCRHFGLDPLGLIGSGALLIAAEPERAADIVSALQAGGVAAQAIGRLLPAEEGRWLRGPDGTARPLPTFEQDEVARLFAE